MCACSKEIREDRHLKKGDGKESSGNTGGGLSVSEVTLTQSFLLKSEEQETLTVQF